MGKMPGHELDRNVRHDSAAYRRGQIGEHGRSITCERCYPGTTEDEEVATDDPYLPDTTVARAAKPLPFGKNLPTVLAEARRSAKRVLVDFEAGWCGPSQFFFSSRRRHTRSLCDWSSDVCSSD